MWRETKHFAFFFFGGGVVFSLNPNSWSHQHFSVSLPSLPSSSLNHSISSRSHFRSFPPTVTLKVFLPCLFRHRAELSVSSPPPPLSLSLPLSLFLLPSSVFISELSQAAEGQPAAVLTLQAYWLRKGERKYSGHDSPCMNLMIPVFICTFPSMAAEEEQINRTPSFFYHPLFRHVSNQIHRRG